MGNLLEIIYDLLMKPQTALAEIAATRSVGQALQIILGSAIISTLGVYANTFEGGGKVFAVVLQLFCSVFIWGISAAVWHLLAELLGGTGSVKQLLTAIGFIGFLQILVVPVYLLATFIPEAGMLLIVIASVMVAIWTLVLQIFAIRQVYGVSGGKATLIFFLPVLIMIVFISACAIAAGSVFMSTASEILKNPPQF